MSRNWQRPQARAGFRASYSRRQTDSLHPGDARVCPWSASVSRALAARPAVSSDLKAGASWRVEDKRTTRLQMNCHRAIEGRANVNPTQVSSLTATPKVPPSSPHKAQKLLGGTCPQMQARPPGQAKWFPAPPYRSEQRLDNKSRLGRPPHRSWGRAWATEEIREEDGTVIREVGSCIFPPDAHSSTSFCFAQLQQGGERTSSRQFHHSTSQAGESLRARRHSRATEWKWSDPRSGKG